MNGYKDQTLTMPKSCLSWSAILAGAIVGIGISFLFNLFTVAIGITAFNMTDSGASILIGGFLGLLITGIVSMFMCGYVSGFLGKNHCALGNSGVVYGFASWTLALILSMFLTANMGQFVYNYSHSMLDPTYMLMTHNNNIPTMNAKVNIVKQRPEVIVNVDKAKTSLGVGAFSMFVLFLAGAFASCIGGVMGMNCKSEACHSHSRHSPLEH